MSASAGFWRVVFWSAYVLGSLMLVLAWLLTQVPRPSHADIRLDFAVRLCVAVLMGASIFIAKRIWKTGEIVPDTGRLSTMQVVLLIAWCEFILAVLGMIGLVVSKN